MIPNIFLPKNGCIDNVLMAVPASILRLTELPFQLFVIQFISSRPLGEFSGFVLQNFRLNRAKFAVGLDVF